MKPITPFLFLFLPIIGLSQSTGSSGTWSLGVNFSLNQSYRELVTTEQEQSAFIAFWDDYEEPSIGFNAGVSAYYGLSDRLEIDAGIQFARYSTTTSNIKLVDATGQSLGTIKFDYGYHFIETPIRLNYHIVNKNFFAYLTGGVSTNFYLYNSQKSTSIYEDGRKEVETETDRNEAIRPIALSVLGGFGIGYQVSDKTQLRLEPLYRRYITTITESSHLHYPYSLGVQIGGRIVLGDS